MATLLLEQQNLTAPAAPAPVRPPAPGGDRYALERGLALMLVAVAALYFRVRDPLYNTAYMDESIYVVYGRMFLAHHFVAPLQSPLQWTFGWYLWPVMATIADRIGGLLALRELAALLGMITVAATYGFASRVFTKTIGVGSAAVMAVLAPAVLVSRIATRDSGSICFFALGLWAFAAAWQENRKRHWALATLCFFAAFLCKYLVAIYFPALVLLALWKGKKPFLLFISPLTLACAAYLALHWGDLLHLLRYGSGYGSLQADAFNIYLSARWDLVLITWLAMLAFAKDQWRVRAGLLWMGALILLVFQSQSRADYDFWKHANYALLFLVPAAVAGVLFVVQQTFRSNYLRQLQWGTIAVLSIAIAASLLGKVQSFDQVVFWPNVNPALAFLENRIGAQDRVLVDDTVFRYYFNPTLSQSQIADPMYFYYHDAEGKDLFGEPAYRAAVNEHAFNYIVLDGGMGEEARRMDSAIRPSLAGYQLQMRAVDPVRGHTIEIYSRGPMPPATGGDPSAPTIRILSPATGATVRSASAIAQGVVTGAQSGWYVRLEVFTNRWYPQGEEVPIASDGTFRQLIYLGGTGRQQCFHLLRATVRDHAGHAQAVALNYGIAREDSAGNCSLSAAMDGAAGPGE